MHVGAVATVDADGFAVHTDGERRTQHRHDVANVGRSDDVLGYGAVIGGLGGRLAGPALPPRLVGGAFQRGLGDCLPGVDGVDVAAVGPECVGHGLGQVPGANVADAPTHPGAGGTAGAAADVDHTPPAG